MEQDQDNACRCVGDGAACSCSCSSSSDCRPVEASSPDRTAESSLASFIINSALNICKVRIR